MTSVRYNPITGDPVLFAPERSGRPNAFAHDAVDVCPFCPGNEPMTPPEVARVERGGQWIGRAFPNKYPASAHHEVIVESPDHNATWDAIDDAAAIVSLYVERYRDMRKRNGVAYASLFKNHGATAGASLDHLHSQLLGSPVLPLRIARESAAFAAATACPLCSLRHAHTIRESDRFAWVAPEASTMMYQQWIVPRRHISEPDAMTDDEMRELAGLLQSSASAMRKITNAYNWSFVSFPATGRGHFYVDVFPRMTSIAGYELGTQTFIAVVDPAKAAERLRK